MRVEIFLPDESVGPISSTAHSQVGSLSARPSRVRHVGRHSMDITVPQSVLKYHGPGEFLAVGRVGQGSRINSQRHKLDGEPAAPRNDYVITG